MELQTLSKHFSTKLELTQRSLHFLQDNSNISETTATINSNFVLLTEIKQKVDELRQVVLLWKQRIVQANIILQHIRQTTCHYRNLVDDLPSRLPNSKSERI